MAEISVKLEMKGKICKEYMERADSASRNTNIVMASDQSSVGAK